MANGRGGSPIYQYVIITSLECVGIIDVLHMACYKAPTSVYVVSDGDSYVTLRRQRASSDEEGFPARSAGYVGRYAMTPILRALVNMKTIFVNFTVCKQFKLTIMINYNELRRHFKEI